MQLDNGNVRSLKVKDVWLVRTIVGMKGTSAGRYALRYAGILPSCHIAGVLPNQVHDPCNTRQKRHKHTGDDASAHGKQSTPLNPGSNVLSSGVPV
jgi:hypothetical protein